MVGSPVYGEGVGTEWFLRPLLSQAILWFLDCISSRVAQPSPSTFVSLEEEAEEEEEETVEGEDLDEVHTESSGEEGEEEEKEEEEGAERAPQPPQQDPEQQNAVGEPPADPVPVPLPAAPAGQVTAPMAPLPCQLS